MASIYDNTSLTEIANAALVQIGNSPIETLTDDNDGNAKICRIMLRQCIAEVEGHASACWDELLTVRELELRHDHGENQRGHGFEFNLPQDMLSVEDVYDEHGRQVDYRIYGQYLYTKQRAKMIRYIRFSDNPGEWSVELKNCVIALLSAKLLGGIVKDFSSSRTAVEQFWNMEFVRWAANRKGKAERSRRGDDGTLRRLYSNGGGEQMLGSPDIF